MPKSTQILLYPYIRQVWKSTKKGLLLPHSKSNPQIIIFSEKIYLWIWWLIILIYICKVTNNANTVKINNYAKNSSFEFLYVSRYGINTEIGEKQYQDSFFTSIPISLTLFSKSSRLQMARLLIRAR